LGIPKTLKFKQPQVLREKDVLDQQRKYISETTSKDEQLKKALEEISVLNKKLAEERTESEEKVRICGKSGLHFLIKLLIPLTDLVVSPYLFALKCINIYSCSIK